MKVSVVIPARNEARVLPALLESLKKQTYFDMEIIVVDDASEDDTAGLAAAAGARVVAMDEASGPAAARNAGAEAAVGDLLLFIDADTQAPPDLIRRFADAFAVPIPPVALVGRYSPRPLNPGRFPRYKARLVDYWFSGRHLCDSFETNLGAISRETFLALGGFDERYRGADVEDYEFGDRVWDLGPIVMDPDLQVGHHFPGFWKNARNFFNRSRMWAGLRMRRKRRFDRSAATAFQALASLFSLLLLLWILALPMLPVRAWLWIEILLILGSVAGNAGFLVFLYSREGPAFALAAAPITIVQQAAAASGAIVGSLESLFKPFDSGRHLDTLTPSRKTGDGNVAD